MPGFYEEILKLPEIKYITNENKTKMKKTISPLLFAALLLVPLFADAGGIVTNTNQSAAFTRNPAQDAVIDATSSYYNPAGLGFLEDGFHFSVSNQSIFQTRTISSTFTAPNPLNPNVSGRMNNEEFEGGVSAPLFPTAYAAYKMGNLAFSLNFNPIGGGGSADFESGLPSFEQQVAVLPAQLSAQGIYTTQYTMQAAFEGSSINYGLQVNAAYAITPMIAVSAGVRYIIAENSYNGYLRNIMINPNQPSFGTNYNGSNMVAAPTFFNDAATTLNGLSAGASGFVSGLQPLIDNELGGVSLIDATSEGYITAVQLAQIQGLMVAAGQDPANLNDMNISTAQAILDGASTAFEESANEMSQSAAATSNMELEATQSGTGIAPVFGVNINFSENFNLALKYEGKAEITMTNSTVVDDVNMYPDGAEVPNDMPAMLAAGVGYKFAERFALSTGFHYYFDKNASYGKTLNGELVNNDQVMDNNFWEAAIGFEVYLADNFLLSTGYLRTQTGVNDSYHSDLSHSLSTNSIGIGGKYMLNDNIGINFGFMSTMYESYTKTITLNSPVVPESYNETYNRIARTFAIGIDFKM